MNKKPESSSGAEKFDFCQKSNFYLLSNPRQAILILLLALLLTLGGSAYVQSAPRRCRLRTPRPMTS